MIKELKQIEKGLKSALDDATEGRYTALIKGKKMSKEKAPARDWGKFVYGNYSDREVRKLLKEKDKEIAKLNKDITDYYGHDERMYIKEIKELKECNGKNQRRCVKLHFKIEEYEKKLKELRSWLFKEEESFSKVIHNAPEKTTKSHASGYKYAVMNTLDKIEELSTTAKGEEDGK